MDDKIRIVIGGDLFPTTVNYDLFSAGNAEDVFGKEVCAIFASSDYSICNLEGCFTSESTAPKLKDGPNIRAPRECVKAIIDLGVDCVSLANNHATDYGLDGLRETCSVLDESKIAYFGAGENESSVSGYHTISIKNKKFIFYGVSETIENVPTRDLPGVNIYDEYRVCNELRSLKDCCDHLIVLYHGGIEKTHYNTSSIRKRFHRMVENGADIIISQHTHAIGEEEYYKGAYLLYGQGNFCFNYSKFHYEWAATGLLLEIDVDDHGISVNKHIVRREDPRIIYDKEQDMTAFYERSKRLESGDDFKKEFREHADQKIVIYLQAFRGRNIFDRIVKKLVSRERYSKYLRHRYTRKNVLKILAALQCEEFREVASQGLYNMLDEMGERDER